MPSYAIHLAVAEEYLRKHKDTKENYDEFIKGVIYPDTVKDKSTTHYGLKSSLANLELFFKENNIRDSFNRGYFLHLLTDYLFYNRYIECWSRDIYHDYDILNEILVEKYHLKIPEEIKEVMNQIENGNLTILSERLVEKFVTDVSDMDIDIVEKEVKDKPEEWTKIRPLKFW